MRIHFASSGSLLGQEEPSDQGANDGICLVDIQEEKRQRLEQQQSLASLAEGKEIIYGQIVQLLHKRTGKFLASKDSDTDEDLGWHDGSRNCWFEIGPHESDRRNGDNVSPF